MSRVAIQGVIAASRRRSAGTPTVLGYSTKGSAAFAAQTAGLLSVSKFTLASPGTLTELHTWFNGGGGGQNIRLVVYDDDGTSAAPGTRLAYTNSLTPPNGDTDVNETGLSVALTAGNYYIGFICENTVGNGTGYRENTGSTHYQIASGVVYNPPPSTFPGGSTTGTRKYSVWGIVLV